MIPIYKTVDFWVSIQTDYLGWQLTPYLQFPVHLYVTNWEVLNETLKYFFSYKQDPNNKVIVLKPKSQM